MDNEDEHGRTIIRFVASNLLEREIERAAAEAGQKVSAWLRGAARMRIVDELANGPSLEGRLSGGVDEPPAIARPPAPGARITRPPSRRPGEIFSDSTAP